jgi:hypothetical protein
LEESGVDKHEIT